MSIGNMKRIHSKTPLSTAAAPEDCGNHFCRLNSLGLSHSWSGRSWFHSWLELWTQICAWHEELVWFSLNPSHVMLWNEIHVSSLRFAEVAFDSGSQSIF